MGGEKRFVTAENINHRLESAVPLNSGSVTLNTGNVRFGSIVLKNSCLKPFCRPDSLVLVTGDAGDDGRTDCDAGGAVLRL